jgi:hypothetical protein
MAIAIDSAGAPPDSTPIVEDAAGSAALESGPEPSSVPPMDLVDAPPPPRVVKRLAGAAANGRRLVPSGGEERDPRALLRQSSAAEAKGDWETVRSTNQKLEKIRGWTGPAVYGQAWAAFQMNDTPAALVLTERAIRLPGPQRNKALLLRADAIFKQGDFKRARDNYLTLRSMFGDSDLRAVVTKKIALCNKQLGLSERDGIKD